MSGGGCGGRGTFRARADVRVRQETSGRGSGKEEKGEVGIEGTELSTYVTLMTLTQICC